MKRLILVLAILVLVSIPVAAAPKPIGSLPFTRTASVGTFSTLSERPISCSVVRSGDVLCEEPLHAAAQSGSGGHSTSLTWTEADTGVTFNIL